MAAQKLAKLSTTNSREFRNCTAYSHQSTSMCNFDPVSPSSRDPRSSQQISSSNTSTRWMLSLAQSPRGNKWRGSIIVRNSKGPALPLRYVKRNLALNVYVSSKLRKKKSSTCLHCRKFFVLQAYHDGSAVLRSLTHNPLLESCIPFPQAGSAHVVYFR